MSHKEEKRGLSDVEELRGVLNTISDFLKGLGPLLSGLIREVMDSLSGEKIGENVATFYRKLKESEMPDDVVTELTRKYYEDLMILDKLVEQFTKRISEGKTKAVFKLGEEEE